MGLYVAGNEQVGKGDGIWRGKDDFMKGCSLHHNTKSCTTLAAFMTGYGTPGRTTASKKKRTLDGSFELGGPQTKPEIFGGNIQGAVWLSELP